MPYLQSFALFKEKNIFRDLSKILIKEMDDTFGYHFSIGNNFNCKTEGFNFIEKDQALVFLDEIDETNSKKIDELSLFNDFITLNFFSTFRGNLWIDFRDYTIEDVEIEMTEEELKRKKRDLAIRLNVILVKNCGAWISILSSVEDNYAGDVTPGDVSDMMSDALKKDDYATIDRLLKDEYIYWLVGVDKSTPLFPVIKDYLYQEYNEILVDNDAIVFEHKEDRPLFLYELKDDPRSRRKNALAELASIKMLLFRLERGYQIYQLYRSGQRKTPAKNKTLITFFREQLELKLQLIITNNLRAHGIWGGIPQFEQLIADFGQSYEKEALATADDLLDCYTQAITNAELRYSESNATEIVYNRLEKMRLKYPRGTKFLDLLAEGHFLFRDRCLPLVERLDLVEIASAASLMDLQAILLNHIGERKKKISEIRQCLHDQPELVYKLPDLIKETNHRQVIREGSIYDLLIKEKSRNFSIDNPGLKEINSLFDMIRDLCLKECR